MQAIPTGGKHRHTPPFDNWFVGTAPEPTQDYTEYERKQGLDRYRKGVEPGLYYDNRGLEFTTLEHPSTKYELQLREMGVERNQPHRVKNWLRQAPSEFEQGPMDGQPLEDVQYDEKEYEEEEQ